MAGPQIPMSISTLREQVEKFHESDKKRYTREKNAYEKSHKAWEEKRTAAIKKILEAVSPTAVEINHFGSTTMEVRIPTARGERRVLQTKEPRPPQKVRCIDSTLKMLEAVEATGTDVIKLTPDQYELYFPGSECKVGG